MQKQPADWKQQLASPARPAPKPRMWSKIPAEQRAEIVAALRAGETCDLLAERFGRPVNTIVDVAKRHGIRPKRTRRDANGHPSALREAMARLDAKRELIGAYARKDDPWQARFAHVPDAAAAYHRGLRALEPRR